MNERISICGAGLVGSLLSIFLVKKGYAVRVFEKRFDPRKHQVDAGRSINLAISQRGLHALKDACSGLDLEALEIAVPMFGRVMHDEKGILSYQAYGESSQHINSIGRGDLNKLLISKAESLGVEFCFDYTCTNYFSERKQWKFVSGDGTELLSQTNELVVGADGAFSVIRKWLAEESQIDPLIHTLDYGYKELEVGITQGHYIENQEALHIWPRERFMLIALPNKDGSYTATLFLPMKGEMSFEALDTEEKVASFFNTYFCDSLNLFPDLTNQFNAHPTSYLSTIHTDNWFNDHTLLIGDAAHALVPFYGQGMNAGFEDCRILSEIIHQKSTATWKVIFEEFYRKRKINTDAISDLALQNFIEMRDLVADQEFLIRKKIEKYLHQQLADKFIPQYTLVSFSDTPYAEAKQIGELHQKILDEIMNVPGIVEQWPTVELELKAIRIATDQL
jgi:kynurenine 3-monooxygenase